MNGLRISLPIFANKQRSIISHLTIQTNSWYVYYMKKQMKQEKKLLEGIFKAKFFEGIQQSRLIIKKEQTKQDRYFDDTNEKSGNYCK